MEACARATGGNPFLVAEVLRVLRADALEPDTAAAAAIAALGPDSVARYVLLRLGRFGEEAVGLTRAIAVLGGAPQLRHVAMLSGVEEGAARQTCDRLREAEILAPGLPIDFVHPLVRQAIYRDLSDGQRSDLHRRAAEVLASTGAAAREIAPHLLACEPNGDQWVVARLREAAREALTERAPDIAKAYLERALREPPKDDLLDRYWLGNASIDTDPWIAPGILRDVAQRTRDPQLRLDALRFASVASFGVGMIDDGIRAAAEAVEAAQQANADREDKLAVEAQFLCFARARGPDRSRSKRLRTIAADVEGRTAAERLVRQALGFERFLECGPVEEVVALTLPFPPAPWEIGGVRVGVPVAAAQILAWGGAWTEVRDELERYLEVARDEGRLNGVVAAHAILAEVDRLSGRFQDAEAWAGTAWDLAAELLAFSPFGWKAKLTRLALLIDRGEFDAAQAMTGELPASAGPREIVLNPWPIELVGYLRLARGDVEGGVENLLAVGGALEDVGWFNPAICPWRQEAAPALVSLGRTAEAKEIITVGEERARAFGAPHVVGTVLRARASLEPRRRQIDTLRESVAALEIYGPPHELARSLVELGAAVRRGGQRSEARGLLRRALELAHGAGAGGIEERAREELAAAGSRPRSAVRTGVAALTASELRTASLAAEGLQNREIAQRLFVTLRTVETHLSHAYEKLQVSGRSELKAALADPAVGR